MSAEETRIHIVPIGDTGPDGPFSDGIHIASERCWCFPFFDGEVYVHNAHDCREAVERRGGESQGWLLIRQDVRDV